ncbi:MAG: biotin--[acetyl-CoA-carboxylase] ligase [candidate division Zixibacteria bacterium]|nr:biotin--[acetyl-CoA-carboxylase] ligase [candidate division Zixibacteria bacterium]
MHVFTDDLSVAKKIVPEASGWIEREYISGIRDCRILQDKIYGGQQVYYCEFNSDLIWQYLFIIKEASGSHYDLLVNLSNENINLPDGILTIADSGKGFHGFKNRRWIANSGNIHLCAYLSPNEEIINYGAGLPILSAVSVVEAIDKIEDLNNRAGIKWVNDILIDGAKVGGFLTQSQPQGNIISGIVLGIGLNVESSPDAEPTPYVPKSACLKEFIRYDGDCGQSDLFNNLIQRLDINYKHLIDGGFRKLFNIYKERSIVINQMVKIHPDRIDYKPEEIIEGKVTDIGENLELYMSGRDSPVFRGRLILK